MKSTLFCWSIAVCLAQIFPDFALSTGFSVETNEVNEVENTFVNSLSLSVLIKALKDSNSNVGICYQKIKNEYESALNEFSYNLKEVAIDFGQSVKLTYEEIGENAQKLSENFAKITSLYPEELENLFKMINLKEALQTVNNFKKNAQDLDSKILEEMNKIKNINSEHGESAEADYKRIRQKVESETEKISTKIEKCLNK